MTADVADERVMAVCREVLDPHVRIAQTEALGNSFTISFRKIKGKIKAKGVVVISARDCLWLQVRSGRGTLAMLAMAAVSWTRIWRRRSVGGNFLVFTSNLQWLVIQSRSQSF